MILAGMVILLATGAVPPAVAGLLAAGAIVLTGVLTVDQAYRGIAWTTVILVGGMIPLSTAMMQTVPPTRSRTGWWTWSATPGRMPCCSGSSCSPRPRPADQQHGDGADRDPDRGVGRAELDVSAKPVLMAVRVASSAAFLTPVATPGEHDDQGPGGYRFGDYWKLGLPLLVLFAARRRAARPGDLVVLTGYTAC